MSERQCMHVVVQDPSLVIGTSHQCLHIINALLARKNDGVAKGLVRIDETVEHGFLSCQQIDVLVIPLLVFSNSAILLLHILS